MRNERLRCENRETRDKKQETRNKRKDIKLKVQSLFQGLERQEGLMWKCAYEKYNEMNKKTIAHKTIAF